VGVEPVGTGLEAEGEADRRRVEAIDAYAVLRTPVRRELRALVELAARVCDVPMATINLITATEQHQVAAVGFDAAICRREDSMCAAVLSVGEQVVVPDARLDDRFRDNPFVTGEIGNVRFYATTHLVTPDGVVIGTLCVFDEQPRVLGAEQAESLATLAEQVVDVLELDVRTRQLTRLVERLKETQDELERSNEQLAAFAGQVSHDLRNPLTAVRLALLMLEEELEPGTDLTMILARAVSGTDRMGQLIDNLLAFGRLGGSLRRVPVDLGRLVDEVREDLAVTLADATLTVGELPVVTGDPVHLRALLQNLLANAAKFARPGAPSRIDVSAERRGARWRVEVADDGRGIAPGDRERVFEPLTQLDSSVDGSGIGLATCRRVVQAHGGTIGLDESPSGGTLAWFELPAGPS
jgi:signal transduction histidine kinase